MGPGDYPLAYFNMPKAACTTIKNLMYRMHTGEWHTNPLGIHRDIRFNSVVPRGREFQENRAQMKQPITVFTFVRNPGYRAYSAFTEKIWATGTYAFPTMRKHIQENYRLSLEPLGEGQPTVEQVRKEFLAFLRFVRNNLERKTPGIPPNPHWCVQSRRISNQIPAELVTFTGRVEQFAKDMTYLLQRAGWEDLSIAEKRFNEGPKAPYSLDEINDPQIEEILFEIYGEDYRCFDYPVTA